MSENEIDEYINMPLRDLEAELGARYSSEGFALYTGDIGKPPKPRDALSRTVDAIQNILNATPTYFRKLICEELKYCEMRKKDIVNLIIAVADTAIITKFALIFPPLLLATYIVRKRLLDTFCRCEANA